MAIKTGMVISHGKNQYIIGDLIRQGGFGRVYQAEKTVGARLQTPIVVKVPADHILQDPVWSKKFAREARILANISHPNVVRIVDFLSFDDGDMALAQEFVAGAQTLHEYVTTHPDRAPSVFLQTLYALRAFHGPGNAEQSIVHRDLSPGNVLVSAQGVVKVIDFGLAKEDPRVTEVLTTTGTWFGTEGCMAPEQYEAAADVDQRADLYSLGRSMAASLQNRSPLHVEIALLPEPWRTLCTRLTKHDASERYSSADDTIKAAIKRFAANGTVLTDFSVHA